MGNRKDAESAEKAKGTNFDFRFPLRLYRSKGLERDKLIMLCVLCVPAVLSLQRNKKTLRPLRLCGEDKND